MADGNLHLVLLKVALNAFPICLINHRIPDSSLIITDGEESGEVARFFRVAPTIWEMKGQEREKEENKNYLRIFEFCAVPLLNFWQADEKGCPQVSDKVPAKLWVSRPNKLDIFFQQFWLQFTDRTLQNQRDKDCGPDIDTRNLQNDLENYWPAFKTHKISRKTARQLGEDSLVLDAGVIWLRAKCQLLNHAVADAGITSWQETCIWLNQTGVPIECSSSNAGFDQKPAQVKHFLGNLSEFHPIKKSLRTLAGQTRHLLDTVPYIIKCD